MSTRRGGSSSSSDRPIAIAGEHDRLSVVIQKRESSDSTDEWLKYLMIDEEQMSNTTSQKEKMRLVLHMADQQNERKHFEPIVVSIGPCHHGKPELQRMEKSKIVFTRQFVRRSAASSDVLYRKVEEVASEARKCYAVEITEGLDHKAFTQMMFLDGCFILQFIYYVAGYKGNEMKMNSRDIAQVKRDLFLLENQLPFQVLEVLMSTNYAEVLKTIQRFIQRIVLPPSGDPRLEKIIKYVKSLLLSSELRQPNEQEAAARRNKQYRHLLDMMWTLLINEKALPNPTGERTDSYSHRSIQELRGAGIYFEPSGTPHFTDVKFIPRYVYGHLALPPMVFTDSTESNLLNLAQYEIDSDYPIGVCSYICFLDSLVDRAEDVKELKSAGILFNYASSDEDVAKSIHNIAAHLVPDDRCYADVKFQIEEYFNNRTKREVRTWIAEGISNHLKSPWTALAVLAGIIALFSSVLQTYFTVYPAPDKCQDSICQYLKNNITSK